MRISTRQTFLNSLDNMQNSQSKLADLQNQISTGKKLNKPSDDPVAAAQVVKLNRELAQTEKYQENINVTQRRLELEETVLDNLNNATTRIKELTIQAGSGILSDADRKTIASEIRGLIDYSAGLMNTQDAQGEYLFSGSRGFDKPYVQDGNGNYTYAGDDGQRLIQVAPELFVPSNDSGEYLFEAAETNLDIRLLGDTVSAGDPFVTIPPSSASYTTAFETEQLEENYQTATKGLGDISVTVTSSGNYSITDSAGNSLSTGTFTDGDTIEFNGLKFDLKDPATIPSTITLVAEQDRQNILDVARELVTVLETPADTKEQQDLLTETISSTLVKLEQVAERNIEARTTIGARLNSLENTKTSNEDFSLFTKTALSGLEDVDFAEAVSELQLEQAILSAAQASFVRIQELSLFNFIR